jgi:hypothetical protein
MNGIRPNGEDRLVGVLCQCATLVHLDVTDNQLEGHSGIRRHGNNIKIMLMKREYANICQEKEEKEGRRKTLQDRVIDEIFLLERIYIKFVCIQVCVCV